MPERFDSVKSEGGCATGMAWSAATVHLPTLRSGAGERGRRRSRCKPMSKDTITWTQGGISEVPLQRFSGRVGALYHASDAFALRASAYSGFRLPTLNELYRPFVVFPITTQANAALTPEKLKGAEAGVDLTPIEGITLSATAFYNRLDDAIANVTVATNTRQRQNVDRIVAKGVELTAAAKLGDFNLSASYAYSHSRVRAPGAAFDGFTPAQTPRHAASATVAYSPAHGPSLSTTLRYVAKQYEDDLQSDVLPDALTLDAIARLPIGHGISLVARGENLFDETVVTRNAGGSMDLGTPRTLWIGVSFGR